MAEDLKELLRSVIKEELSPINQRLGSIEHKLEGISDQVAQNTENDTALTELSSKVKDLDIDVRLIKKAVLNQ